MSQKPLSNPASIRVHDYAVTGTSLTELRQLKQEIFTQHSYYVELDNPQPTILDIGAHVGLASLYFTHLYPGAEIIAVEPHPVAFRLLEKNLAQNIITTVTPIQAAVISGDDQTTTLYADPSSEWLSNASLWKSGWNSHQTNQPLTVPATTLSKLLEKKFHWDIVKIDIEGAELEILMKPQPLLTNVSHLLIEAHKWDMNEYKKLVSHLAQYKLRPENEKSFAHKLKLQMVEFVSSH